jgi:hypothetical protein
MHTLDGAQAARQQLASAGFTRDSIDIERQGDGFRLFINVRDKQRERAETLLARSPVVAFPPPLGRPGHGGVPGQSPARARAG